MLAAGAALDGVDQDGNTALLIAVAEAHGELALALLRAGADVSVRNHADEGVHDLAEERGLDQLIAWREFFEQNPAIVDGTAKLSEELAAGLRLDGTGYEGEVDAAAAAPLEGAVPLEAAEEL